MSEDNAAENNGHDPDDIAADDEDKKLIMKHLRRMSDRGENVQNFLLGCIIETGEPDVKGSSTSHIYKLQELLVYGFIRIYCVSSTMPIELQQFCMALYLHDYWNIDKHTFTKGLEFGLKSNNVPANATKITSKIGHHWCTAFGSHIIRKGQFKRWTLRQILNRTDYNNDTMVGIIRADKIFEMSNCFTDKLNDGYGILSKNGRKIHASKCDNYCKKWNRQGAVQMTLDMTGIKNDKFGILSYVVNNRDYGIAFDRIDIDKGYCLAVSLFWIGDAYQIIE